MNAYGLGYPNPLMVPPNRHNCFPSLPLVADSDGSSSGGWPSWLGWAIPAVQVVAGIALCFVPGGQGLGVSLIIGGALGFVGQAVGSHIGGGIGSIMNGAGAMGVGIRLMFCGPVGLAIGIPLTIIGAGTVAFGANEINYGVTGVNNIQNWTGMSDGWYNGIYLGLNVASSVGQIAGRMYINYYNAKMFAALPKPPGYDDGWDYRYGTREGSGKRFFDPNGGEWRWHAPDRWHPNGHWDYNPWDSWNSPWQNV